MIIFCCASLKFENKIYLILCGHIYQNNIIGIIDVKMKNEKRKNTTIHA